MSRFVLAMLVAPWIASLNFTAPVCAQDEAPAASDPIGVTPPSTQTSPPKPKIRRAAPKPVTPVASPAVSASTPIAAAEPIVLLPNGASSIVETYGDWTMTCRIENGGKVCVASQTQGNKDTGQRSFAIELRTPRSARTDGTILMPFGLRLEAGAILKLDDKDLGQGLRFSTCVSQGCLLPVSLPTVATDAMKTAQKLTVAALSLGNGEPVTFTISLNGFAAVLDRIAQLGA